MRSAVIALVLIWVTIPTLSSPGQSYISDDLGLNWYSDYGDERIRDWFPVGDPAPRLVAAPEPRKGRVTSSPDYDDDAGDERIDTSPSYMDDDDDRADYDARVGRDVGVEMFDRNVRDSDDFRYEEGVVDEDFGNDDYGSFDNDYNWSTDDENFNDWYEQSDEPFKSGL